MINRLLKTIGQSKPNPIWVREMQQIARMKRTSVVLALLTISISLLTCAIGAIAVSNTEASRVGTILFHTFFSIAYFVVTWLGSGLAAVSIANERSGDTWEMLLLTRMGNREIAEGKFLAAFSHVGIYVVMLAPVGALALLFGGVTALEVILAYLILLAIAALAVGFGLSVSSALKHSSSAALITLPMAVGLSIGAYLGLGVSGSIGASALWPSVLTGAPVWLPSAMVRAEPSLLSIVLLWVTPTLLTAAAASFFYELTVTHIAKDTGLYSQGLRLWYAIVTPCLAILAALIVFIAFPAPQQWLAFAAALLLLLVHQLVSLSVFAVESPAPHPAQARTGSRRKWLVTLTSPGLIPSVRQVLWIGAGTSSVLTLLGVALQLNLGSGTKAGFLLTSLGYSVSLLLFLSGAMLFLRAAAKGPGAARVMLVLGTALVTLGPWLLAGIVSLMTNEVDSVLWLAAPSPAYVIVIFNALQKGAATFPLLASTIAICLWSAAGIGLRLAAASRIRAQLNREERQRQQLRLEAKRSRNKPNPQVHSTQPTAPRSPHELPA